MQQKTKTKIAYVVLVFLVVLVALMASTPSKEWYAKVDPSIITELGYGNSSYELVDVHGFDFLIVENGTRIGDGSEYSYTHVPNETFYRNGKVVSESQAARVAENKFVETYCEYNTRKQGYNIWVTKTTDSDGYFRVLYMTEPESYCDVRIYPKYLELFMSALSEA
jgi:hypothetical protein